MTKRKEKNTLKMSNNNNKIIINANDNHQSTISSSTSVPPSPQTPTRKCSIENYSIVNLDYNDNKTIITLKGDGGEGEITSTVTNSNGVTQWNGIDTTTTMSNGIHENDDKVVVNINDHNHNQSSCGVSINGDNGYESNSISSNHENDINEHEKLSTNSKDDEEGIDNEFDDDDEEEEENNEEFSISDSEIDDILEENDDEETNGNQIDDKINAISDSLSKDLDVSDKEVFDTTCSSGASISISSNQSTISHQNSSGSSVIYVSGDNSTVQEEIMSNSRNNSSHLSECDNDTNGANESVIEERHEAVNMIVVNQSIVNNQNQVKGVVKKEDNVDAVIDSRRSSSTSHPKHHHQYDDEHVSEEDEAFVEILGKANEIVGFIFIFEYKKNSYRSFNMLSLSMLIFDG